MPPSPSDSPASSFSSKKSCHFSPDIPVLTIIPPTLAHLPTPPLTPLTPLTPCLKNRTSFFPGDNNDRTVNHTAAPGPATPLLSKVIEPLPSSLATPTPALPSTIPIPTPHDAAHQLHAPLCAHLTLLHPSTPHDIIHFCATRLLSRDRPLALGSEDDGTESPPRDKKDGEEGEIEEGEWTPIWAGIGDLATAGLGREAAKGCEQVGPGKEIDERLEWMYGVARRSWEMLEMRAPGRGDRL